MSTRAQRRERAHARRSADPVADRSAAAEAIYAQYDEARAAAFSEASAACEEAWREAGRKEEAAWAERCRKLGELEDREPARTPEEAAAAKAEAAEAELEESIGAQQERADIEESGL